MNIYIDDKISENNSGFIIPMSKNFPTGKDCFNWLQALGPVLCDTATEVCIFDQEYDQVAVYDLEKDIFIDEDEEEDD